MRWSFALTLPLVCGLATGAVAQPAAIPQANTVLTDEHHALGREAALARLAQHGSQRVAELGGQLGRDMAFSDDQVTSVAKRVGTNLASSSDANDLVARGDRDRISHLTGPAFDRAVVAAIRDQLTADLAWIDGLTGTVADDRVVDLLATMRPMLLHYQAAAAALANVL